MENRPGWQTTEFWLMMIKMIGSLALASGVFDPGSVQVATDTTTQLVGPVIQILGSFGLVGGGKDVRNYTSNRTNLKR
jgi:hypothetical protein